MTFTFDDFGNPEATRTGYAPFGDQQTWYRITGTLESPVPPMIAVHGGRARLTTTSPHSAN